MTHLPSLAWVRVAVLGFACSVSHDDVFAQVHYHENGQPWKQRANKGPDAEVPGWYYNLGPTGLRIELVAAEPKAMVVRHVFAATPAAGRVAVGDVITGAGSTPFRDAHQNGYGMKVFGARGPVSEFAAALDACAAPGAGGKLQLTVRRGTEVHEVVLELGSAHDAYGPEFPVDCAKSTRVRENLLAWLRANQRKDGSFGNPVHDTFAPLALLATGRPDDLERVERCARRLASRTAGRDESQGLRNWNYMTAAIVLSEYFLATKADWVPAELQEVHDFLAWSQYLDMAQLNPKAKESHPHSFPKGPMDSHGGWGHNPGFEGYGPIAMLTGQGALAYALMHRCGIRIDRERHDAAYAFLARGTGPNGYVWYGDGVGDPKGWADMGRTGAAGIANLLSPWPEPVYRERALAHARVIGAHPESFPDTHGSPVLGMGYAALAAHGEAASFRKLMDANRWWFTLAECPDGTCYYQPNRDNAGYGADARMSATAVSAFILSIPLRTLVITGKGEATSR